MSIFKDLKTWILLLYYTRIIKKYDKECPLGVIKYKGRKVQFLKIKINCKLVGLIITSENVNTKGTPEGITRIEFIWANPKLYQHEAEAYQVMYETFMQWQHLFLTPIDNKGMREYKVTIVLDVTNKVQIERFRRVLTLYGFYPDANITISNLTFKKPWREKEVIKDIVYSRLF